MASIYIETFGCPMVGKPLRGRLAYESGLPSDYSLSAEGAVCG